MDSLNIFFIILTLLPTQTKVTYEYNEYINSSKNFEADKLLNQPSEKRASTRKAIFVKGKHNNIEDFAFLIANSMVYARYWVNMDPNIDKSQPLIIQLLVEISGVLSSATYIDFNDNFKDERVFMPHTL